MQYPLDPKDFNFRGDNPNLKDYQDTSIQDIYFQGWQSAFQYCWDVLNEVKISSTAEKQSVERFIKDLHREDLTLNVKMADFCCIVSNSLKHEKGTLANTPIKLLPWQIFHFLNLFGWTYNEKVEDKKTIGWRRFSKSFLFIARGNGKTQMAAITAIVGLLLNTNGRPVITCSASSRDQAKKPFDDIKGLIKKSTKSIKTMFDVREHDIKIRSGGVIKPTSSMASNLEGDRIYIGILDELKDHPDSSVANAISSSQGATKDALLYQITTAGPNINCYAHDVYRFCKQILNEEILNDNYLVQIFESECEDPSDQKGWEQANPSLDHAVFRHILKYDQKSSLVSPAEIANFATKHLNKWHQFAESGFVDTEIINNCFTSSFPSEDELKELPCYMGLDLAAVSDLSSIVRVHIGKGNKLYVKSQSFIPHSAYESLPMNLKSIYMKGINSKSLRLCGTKVTDLEEIKDEIRHYYKTYTVEDTGIDAAQGGERFAEEYQSETGYELAAVNQGYGLSDAAYRLLRGMTLGNIVFDENDHMMRWCIENGRTYIGQHGDMKIIKSSNDSLKIDCLVALLIAMAMIPAVEQGFGITLV
ncbi:terminase large subunit domain-containing protein [Aeromonas sp.]|uniref:terminase large subunit domain-containing protein n=1 Tax=Aeromonas sp. TaxID=647 RepID=UPI00290E4F43|nr:terminase large subunit [Aeromonas sp.]MDU7582329.1 terminase large subunit [Aeromonas sp.]